MNTRRGMFTLFLAFVFGFSALPVFAQNNEKSGFYGRAGASLLQPGEVNDIDYASKSSGGNINQGEFHNVEFDFGGAYSLEVGHRASSGAEFAVQFWTGSFDDDDSVSGSGNVDSLIAHGENDDSAGNDRITADQEVDLDRFSLLLRHPLHEQDALTINGSAGLTYASIDTSLQSTAFSGGSRTWFVDSKTDNRMIGPRVGSSAAYKISDLISFNLHSGISLLRNDQESELEEGPSSVSEPRDFNDDSTGLTPAFDMELGVTAQPTESLTIGLGYQFMWFREVSTYHHGPDDVNDPVSIERSNDLSLDGIKFDITYVF